MTDKKRYDDWRELFIQEKKGEHPEDCMYSPVPEISISPYLDQKKGYNPPLIRSQSSFSHSFILDSSSMSWMSKMTDTLQSYLVKSFFIEKDTPSNESKDFSPLFPDNKLKTYNPKSKNTPIILDLGNADILPSAKLSFESIKNNNNELWLKPGHDFLWNTALLRGIAKYLMMDMKISSFSDLLSIVIPFPQSHHPTDESQLIALSNQFLAMMIGGLNHCIWDVRNATDWQRSNITHLLNVPEILAREGKILIQQDPIAGSDFFEQLSTQVMAYFQK